jgi:transposase-like protein
MVDVQDQPIYGGETMAKRHRRLNEELVQGALLDDPEFLRGIVEGVLQHLLEAQITEHLGAAPYQRSESRKGHRNGYKPRKLKSRVGTLELLVPQDLKKGSSPRACSLAISETRRRLPWH